MATIKARLTVSEMALLRKIFDRFDKSGMGRVGPSEFILRLHECGINFSEEEINLIQQGLDRADANQDGVLSFIEFADMMRNHRNLKLILKKFAKIENKTK